MDNSATIVRKQPAKDVPLRLRIIGQTSDGVVVLDGQHRIVFWNKGAERLLGYKQSEVRNRFCHQVLGGTSAGKAWCCAGCQLSRSVERGLLPDSFELSTRSKQGKEICLNVSTIVLPGKRRALIAHLLRDISLQSSRERALETFLTAIDFGAHLQAKPQSTGSRVPDAKGRGQELSKLTRREIEVLGLATQGVSTKEIAQRLGVSFFTVRNHLQNLFPKLGVQSKAEAVSYAFRNGLV